MMAATKNLVIAQGKTFQQLIRWEAPPIVYAAISNISQGAPAVITANAHGMPDGWRCAVVSAKGMKEINATNTPLRDSDYKMGSVPNANTVMLNAVNSSEFKPYTSGGYVQYNSPVDMTGFTARLAIKDKVGGTVLKSLTTENAGIAIDNTKKTITLTISATETAAFTWTKGVYELEMVSPLGVVTALLVGVVTLLKEITT